MPTLNSATWSCSSSSESAVPQLRDSRIQWDGTRSDRDCECTPESAQGRQILFGSAAQNGLLFPSHWREYQTRPSSIIPIPSLTNLQRRQDGTLAASIRSSNERHLRGKLPFLVSVTHEVADLDALNRAVHILNWFLRSRHTLTQMRLSAKTQKMNKGNRPRRSDYESPRKTQNRANWFERPNRILPSILCCSNEELYRRVDG